jgi:hypothetical protein
VDLPVTIPPGIAIGARLTLAGQGDHRSNQAEDLIVELVDDGPKSVELLAQQRAREDALFDEWDTQRVRQNRQIDRVRDQVRLRRWRWLFGIGLLLFGLMTVGLLFKQQIFGAVVGEKCKANKDCASDLCLTLETMKPISPLGMPPLYLAHESNKVCTSACTTDSDCPVPMRCEGVESSYIHLFIAPPKPNALACVPPEKATSGRR